MGQYLPGTVRPADVATYMPKTTMGTVASWFINRTPLFSRLPKTPCKTPAIQMYGFKFRPRTTRLAADPGTTGTITVTDASIFMNGDVLQLSTGEYVEILTHPDTSANTVSVRRGIGTAQNGMTPVAATAISGYAGLPAGLVVLVGNSRTGAEVEQKAISALPSSMLQYIQHFQHVVSVGGGVVASDFTGSTYLPPNARGPFESHKMTALTNLVDDMESSALIGMGEANTDVTRAKMYGFSNILSTNRVRPGGSVTPTTPSAYTADAFLTDTFQRIRDNGGNPTVAFLSSDFMTGLWKWGMKPAVMDMGETVFGVAINGWRTPLGGGTTLFVEAPMQPKGSALILTGEEVQWAVMEAVRFAGYGRRGDAEEGDWIARVAIAVENEAHHAFLTGITGFAA